MGDPFHCKEVLLAFQVIYIDNYDAPRPGASWNGGSFASYEEAVAHCKGVVAVLSESFSLSSPFSPACFSR